MAKRTARLLVIDDRVDLARFCERELADHWVIEHAPDGRTAQELLAGQADYEAVLLDRDFSEADPRRLVGPASEVQNEGIAILRWIREEAGQTPVVMVTGYREQRSALAAAEMGADYLAWSDIVGDPHILRARLEHAIERSEGEDEAILARFREMGVVVSSARFARTLIDLAKIIDARVPILLLGETGTGKDTLAYAIHALTGDSSRPYVAVNVAALNPNIIESELFGHTRGAFTGASRTTEGKLRFAHGGTLFLNEIADLPREVQAKLLSAIEHKAVTPVGDNTSHPADFRLITATSQDLRRALEENRFREDLYYRIAWHTVEIPALRDRREDIPALVRAFVRRAGQGREGGVTGIAQEAIEYLCTLPWRGNVRELRSVIDAACSLARYFITLVDVRQALESRRDMPMGAADATGATGDTQATQLTGLDRTTDGRGMGADPQGDPASEPGEARDALDRVFGKLTYRELTEAYFRYLHDRTGGRVPEIAKRAGIAKSTAYEWKDRLHDSIS